jgi:hypothetical protein
MKFLLTKFKYDSNSFPFLVFVLILNLNVIFQERKNFLFELFLK